MIFKDKFKNLRDRVKLAFGLFHQEKYPMVKGHFFFDLRDLDGNILAQWDKPNLVTHDAGILAARLHRDNQEPANGINMLAVGTGATGNVLSPDAPDKKQRKLNAEISRKGFSTRTFRDGTGAAVSYPTNILDLTTQFGAGEAVGPLTEMGLISTISDNPTIKNNNPNSFPTRDTTIDLTQYDILCNYLTFGAITKPSQSILTLTWRLTF